MKKKAVFVTIFFGTILLTSTVALSLPNLLGVSLTTPGSNYTPEQQDRFCGPDTPAKSTAYVQEYKIPTYCTNPLAITTGPDGNVWFVQSNTGSIAKFDVQTKEFTEFANQMRPAGTSMSWGMDYSPYDGAFWFTDDIFDSIWKFSPSDESYRVLNLPAPTNNTLPQKIEVFGANLIYNDFTSGLLSIITPVGGSASILLIPPTLNGSVASDFATDSGGNIWYASWVPGSDVPGNLVRFDYPAYNDAMSVGIDPPVFSEYMDVIELPEDATTINGIDYVRGGGIGDRVWMADTANSFFFSFDPFLMQFTKYVTSEPTISSYGNATGLVKDPVSGPYWMENAGDGRIVFNQQTANRIAVMDTAAESLVEYVIPSRNPNWGDCDTMDDGCGLAQVFDFVVRGQDEVWFTEWVVNNIGVVDISSGIIPFSITLVNDEHTVLAPGGSAVVDLVVLSGNNTVGDVSLVASSADPRHVGIDIVTDLDKSGLFEIEPGLPKAASVEVFASDGAVPGTYKVLFGLQTDEITVGQFITVMVVE